MTLPDQIDEATNYIRKLQEEVGRLKERRETLRGVDDGSNSHSGAVQIKVNEMEGALEVTLVTGLEFQFVFNEVIRILHEENAEVLNASYSAVEGTVFHTIHAQVCIHFITTNFQLVNVETCSFDSVQVGNGISILLSIICVDWRRCIKLCCCKDF